MKHLIITSLVFSVLFSSLQAQVRKFRPNEVIDAGNGLKIEVLKCRGEGEGEECDVIYYTDKRQQGTRVWEKSAKIKELEQAAKKAKTPAETKVQPVKKSETKILPVQKPQKKDTVANKQPEIKKEEIVPELKTSEPVINIPKPVYVKPANTYSLEQCFKIALEQNIGLKKANNFIAVNNLDRKTAQYNFLPSVSYNLGHYFSFGKNIDPVTNNFVTDNFSGGYTAVGLQMELFSGFGRINAIKQATYLTEASRSARKKAELELLANVTVIYSKLLLNKELSQLTRNNIGSTAKQLEVINEKVKVGRLTKYEAYAFTARLNTEQANLITIQNDSAAAAQDIKNLLNLSYKQDFTVAPVDTFYISKIYSDNIYAESYIDTILLNHPAIAQARLEERAALSALKIAQSNLYPTLSVGGNVASNYNVDQTNSFGQKIPLTTQLNNNLGENVNVSLRIPIFSKMQNANQIKKERININNARLNTQETQNIIATNTLQLINDFKASRLKYLATLSARDLNVLSYSMYEEKYKLGQISSIEVLIARDLLNVANSQFVQARLEMFFRYQLLQLLQNKN